MPAPIVSVVMPTFNRLPYVRDAVASVYAQTLGQRELIVADDGSGEETRRFLASAPDARMNVLFHEHTGIPAAARNRAIARARGRYVAFLDFAELARRRDWAGMRQTAAGAAQAGALSLRGSLRVACAAARSPHYARPDD